MQNDRSQRCELLGMNKKASRFILDGEYLWIIQIAEPVDVPTAIAALSPTFYA